MRVAAADPVEREQALAEICALYWRPVYAFVRSRGYPPHDAEDLTQGLFARLLEHNDFAKVDSAQGRLRSYLLTAAQHFLITEHRRGQSLKRGGGAVLLSLDAEKAEVECLIPEPADEMTPERVFDRQWALTVMESVVRDLEARYAEKGQAELFAALKPCLLTTVESSRAAETARHLGLTEQAVGIKRHRLRQRYAEMLRKTVRATLGTRGDVEAEIRHLLQAFSA